MPFTPRTVPQRGPKREAYDEEQIQAHQVAKAEHVRAQAADRLYRSAMAQHKKKKELAQQGLDDNCTFKPKLAASGRKRAKAVANKKPAHERMYQQAKEARRKKADVRRQLSDPKRFQPKMVSKSTRKRQHQKAKGRSKGDDFLSRLAKDGRARRERVTKNRETEQTRLEEKGYTFKPKISSKKKLRSPSPSLKERVSNYKQQAAEREAKRKALKAKYDLQNCSFKPKLVRSKSAPRARASGSFLERQKENERLQKSRLNRLITEKEEKLRKSVTLKPRIKVDKSMLRHDPDGQPLHERLYRTGAQKLRTRQLASKPPLDNECTFKPKIRRSKSAPRARATSEEPIHDRLYGEMRRQKEYAKRAKQRREKELLKSCTFKPNLTKSKNKNIGGATANSDEPIWERLNIEKEKKDKMLAEKEKKKQSRQLQDCSFKPTIKYHPAHEQYEEDEPIWERLHTEPIGFSAEEPTGADQETFQPQINDVSEKIVERGRDESEPIHERLFSINLKEQQDEREKEKERRELRACTFKPERNSIKNKEVAVQNDTDVFERLQSTQTESISRRFTKSPESNLTPAKSRTSGSASGAGLSFLERMAKASAKQKSQHGTPKAVVSGTAAHAQHTLVGKIKRPVRPRLTDKDHTELATEAPPPANSSTEDAPDLPNSIATTFGEESLNENDQFDAMDVDDLEGENHYDEEEEEEEDDAIDGGDAPLEF